MSEAIPPTITKEQLAAAMKAKGYDGLEFILSEDGASDAFILYRSDDPGADFVTCDWKEILRKVGLFNPEPGTRNPEQGNANAS